MDQKKKKHERECTCGFEDSIDWKDRDSDQHILKRLKRWIKAKQELEIESLHEGISIKDVPSNVRDAIGVVKQDVIKKAEKMMSLLDSLCDDAHEEISEARNKGY